MFHRIHSVGDLSIRAKSFLRDSEMPFPLASFPLLIGLVFGSVIGLYSSLPADISPVFSFLAVDGLSVGFAKALWDSSRFVITSLLLATSFIGFLFVPALSALRGFLLGLGVAVSFQNDGLHGLIMAFFSFGFPALLGLPAFILASSDSAACSVQLLRSFSRGGNLPFQKLDRFPRHFLAIFVLCILEAFYSAFLLPVITGLFP